MIEQPASISRKILFVDDEALLLEGIKRQLRREYDVTIAVGAQAGLETLAANGPFAVVVSDYNMPGMDGIQFLSTVYQRYPQTILIMLTGRAELDVAVNALHTGHVSRFLNKPCPKEILLETLNDGLEQYRLRESERILQAQLQLANQQLHILNTQLEMIVAQKTRALNLQYQYAKSMTEMHNSAGIIAALEHVIIELTGITQLNIWLSPQLDGKFQCYLPEQPEIVTLVAPTPSEGLLAITLGQKQIWHSATSSILPTAFELSLFAGQPYLSIPLLCEQGVLGLINIAGNNISLEQDVLETLAGIATTTATALQSHWNREAFDDAQDAIITALAKLSEYRDPETGAHLLRLKKYSTLICEALAQTDAYRNIITPAFTQDLVRSSPLHDIGKVGIPDAILKKPGRLTPEEFEIMKTHASIGGDTLRSVFEQYPSQGFIKCGMEIAYGHHEKWDGSGYPLGIQAEAIPLAARILALVDVYDALTTQRVYKPAFPREKAKNIILEGKGSHFAPDLVDAFLAKEADFHRIAVEMADTE